MCSLSELDTSRRSFQSPGLQGFDLSPYAPLLWPPLYGASACLGVFKSIWSDVSIRLSADRQQEG